MQLQIRLVPVLALVMAGGFPLAAQRGPVLKQVAIPHSYYFREMYLPQVTSGPSSAAWSPDGTSLVYSMQGSLWRQRVGDSVAEQLTAGPEYAYQPDWSPDGRQIVYASYRDDAVELRVLNLERMDTRALVRNGAVNVDPRWSPDGSRIAFVSTAFEGRFHVYSVGAEPSDSGGASGAQALPAPVRITPDHDSGLPRYYYSRYDHYLSPTWSPDGRELILISNRGKIWGTGGLWRMEASPDAEMRPVHDEETNWRARPDWARDGRRVVYASYLGRQWHQLWLTTAEGGDPFQLTYGEFDAVNPRWSPDGRRIAYVSNETGNTALYVVSVPGGGRIRIEPRLRVYHEPVGRVTLTVVDAATGRPVPARISLTLADGRSVAPDDAWRHADDGFDRERRRYEVGYFHSAGTSTLTVPAGEVTLEVSHGLEYRVYRERLRVEAGAEHAVRVRLARFAALPGWTSGDLHVHMNYGGHYRATPSTLAFQARAEGLNLVENLIVNKEDRVPDVGYFTGRPDSVSTRDLLILHDQEFHTSFWGHTGALGLQRNLVLPDYAGYAGTAAASLYPDNHAVAGEVHAQGGLVGYVHPFDGRPDPFDTTVALTESRELPVDVALGAVDYIEVVGFSNHLYTSEIWYRLLNCGFRIPAGAGTDAMTNYASLRGPLGTNRVYVESGIPLDRDNWYASLKAGKSFATNGPLLQLRAGTTGIGGELKLPAGTHRIPMRVWVRSIVPLDHVEIVGNGQVVATIPLRGERMAADTTVQVEVAQSGWFVLRAWSEKPAEPVLDLYPFGTTSPIYVTLGGRPARSATDAEFFLRWIDRITAQVGDHQGWNTGQEREEVLARLARARAEFEARQ